MLTLTTFFKVAWLWLRHHWAVPLIVVAVMVLMFLNHDKAFELMNLLTKQKTSYDTELEKLKAAHQAEIDARDEALRRYHATIAQVEANYQSQQQVLDDAKRKEVEKIIKSTSDDPDELARKLSEATGFRVILPQE
jgi:hypothetical protein